MGTGTGQIFIQWVEYGEATTRTRLVDIPNYNVLIKYYLFRIKIIEILLHFLIKYFPKNAEKLKL